MLEWCKDNYCIMEEAVTKSEAKKTYELIEQVHNTSVFFFFLIAFIYVLAVLLFRNDVYAGLSLIIMRVLDVPFAAIALTYGATSLILQIEEDKKDETSPWVMVIVAVSLIMFIAVATLNFAFPSVL